MGTIALYAVMGSNALVSLLHPWVGIILAYLISVLAPQHIWWWIFQDFRPLLWVLVPTLAGFILAVLAGKVSFSNLNTKLNWFVSILWFSFTISFYCGPYVDVYNEYRFYDSEFMFSTLQKTYLTYFVAVTLIDSTKKLKFSSLIIIITVIYMTYWANAQYFIYEKFGRLHGPMTLGGHGIYSDENNFAVLFVVGFPFLFYLGYYLNNKLATLAILVLIPFSWHAVFLTASRGALVGIAAILITFIWRQEKKAGGLLVIVAFLGAFLWQAGDVMKSRSSTIINYEQEDSAASRVDAWKAAIGMMKAYPITGVGFASFGQAFPDFSDKVPRIAHNTFFQIAGEWGVLAGFSYLALIFSTIRRLYTNGARIRLLKEADENRFYYCLNEACLLALIGFFVCSLFLSLEAYEVLYYLLLISNGALIGSRCSMTKREEKEFKRLRKPKSYLLHRTPRHFARQC